MCKQISEVVVDLVLQISSIHSVDKVIISKQIELRDKATMSIKFKGPYFNRICGIPLVVDDYLPGMYVVMFNGDDFVKMFKLDNEYQVQEL